MKRLLAFSLSFSAAVLLTCQANAVTPNVSDYAVGDAANGIGDSRHNLGAYNPFVSHIGTESTSEICVFCHTPHHTNSVETDYRPLWNRGLGLAAPYTTYGTTIGGTNVTSVGSTTLACLSCHDGVTTFDNLVNAPGKKGIATNPQAGQDQGWSFDENEAPMLDYFPAYRVRFVIGSDLSNDHPMSVVYNPGVASLRPVNTTISAIDLNGDLSASAQSGNLAQNKWAVKGFISDTATISDLLRGGKVECSSCHDPHFNNKSWDEIDATYITPYDATGTDLTNGMFLRRVGGNSGSGVCRTCHNK